MLQQHVPWPYACAMAFLMVDFAILADYELWLIYVLPGFMPSCYLHLCSSSTCPGHHGWLTCTSWLAAMVFTCFAPCQTFCIFSCCYPLFICAAFYPDGHHGWLTWILWLADMVFTCFAPCLPSAAILCPGPVAVRNIFYVYWATFLLCASCCSCAWNATLLLQFFLRCFLSHLWQ